MIPYIALLFLTVIIARVGRRYGSSGIRWLTLVIVVVLLVLFAGIRDQSVGTDTDAYIDFLNQVASFDEIFSFKVEPGFNALMLMSGRLSESYIFFLVNIAAVVVILYVSTIARITLRYETALFIFITMGSYTFFFNGARQGIAAALCFFALPWLLERRILPYFLLVGFASIFHTTALVAIPIYFVAKARVGWRELLVIATGTGVIVAFLSLFVQFAAFFDEKYLVYGQPGEGGGYVKVAFLVGQGALLLWFKKEVDDPRRYYARLLNIYLLGLVPALASVVSSVNPSGILRLTIYFEHTAILLWPMVFLSLGGRVRVIASGSFLLVTLAYFLLTTSSYSDLTPYRINSELSV